MFSKTAFKYLSLADGFDNYFLRKDRLLAAFHIDSELELPFTASALSDLVKERKLEEHNVAMIASAAKTRFESSARIVSFTLSIWEKVDNILKEIDKEEESHHDTTDGEGSIVDGKSSSTSSGTGTGGDEAIINGQQIQQRIPPNAIDASLLQIMSAAPSSNYIS